MSKIGLIWNPCSSTAWMGRNDGDTYAVVTKYPDGSWAWSTTYTDTGIEKTVNGFSTADEARAAADIAYSEWLESLGDPFEDMPAIDPAFIDSLGKFCGLYGTCPYGCTVGNAKCSACHEYTEDEILAVFQSLEEDDE